MSIGRFIHSKTVYSCGDKEAGTIGMEATEQGLRLLCPDA
jgi:hypothetical protein